jgi:NitT/TauT family transport system substrate-binding protein
LIAKRLGGDVQVFPISDIGFNPYTDVMATSGELLRSKPEMVKSMVAAVREGLRIYLDNPQPTNLRMQQLNPTMGLEMFTESAEAQRPLIETEETRKNGLGVMTRERWEALIMQLKNLGDIENAPAAEDCFRSL